METIHFFLIILSFILIWFIIKYVTKFLFKLSLLFLVMIISIFSFFYFTKKNIFDTMNELYCTNINSIELKCKCFVLNINKDLEENFSSTEIDSIKNNTIESMAQFVKSYENKKENIRICFEENGFPGGIVEEIKVDLIKKTSSFFDSKD
ncbi:MAG: hypothetical protein CMP68_04795 [Flavobacteriales bacterium]|nr:hypothetical protein [Flavobacteriales bacterium]